MNGPNNDNRIIAAGLTIFACGLIVAIISLNAIGQVRGTFHYTPEPEMIELIKWLIGAAAFGGSVGLATSAIVAVRSKDSEKE